MNNSSIPHKSCFSFPFLSVLSLAELSRAKKLKDLEIYKFKDTFEIRLWTSSSYSTISLSKSDAEVLMQEIAEWIEKVDGLTNVVPQDIKWTRVEKSSI
jgi:hypothetical protein